MAETYIDGEPLLGKDKADAGKKDFFESSLLIRLLNQNSLCIFKEPTVLQDTVPTVERALRMYAEHHKLPVADVTEKLLEESPEGLEHWACLGLDMGARSATGQAINRAFARSSKAKEIYKWLGEDLKRKFRMSWSLHRNFDTVVKKRLRVLRNTKKQTELGSWKSELQLQVHYGGAGIPEAERQASCYMARCREYKD